MPEKEKMIIMKFGGGVLQTESFHRVADIIERHKAQNCRIAVVVSAMRGVTNQLIALAKSVNPDPPRREYDMLVSVGERVSMALLAMALAKRGIEAASFTGSQSGVITTDQHGEAEIIEVRPGRLLPYLESKKVVIVAGFQGVSLSKEITTLGRGGSDTTAVALGSALAADQIIFYKDVSAICDADPKKQPNAKPFERLSYEQALEVVQKSGGWGVIHPSAIRWAQKHRLSLKLLPFWEERGGGTVIDELSGD